MNIDFVDFVWKLRVYPRVLYELVHVLMNDRKVEGSQALKKVPTQNPRALKNLRLFHQELMQVSGPVDTSLYKYTELTRLGVVLAYLCYLEDFPFEEKFLHDFESAWEQYEGDILKWGKEWLANKKDRPLYGDLMTISCYDEIRILETTEIDSWGRRREV